MWLCDLFSGFHIKWLFLVLRNGELVAGRRFDNKDDVINEVEKWFQAQSAEYYNIGIWSAKNRWGKMCKSGW